MLLSNLFPDEIIDSVYTLDWEELASTYRAVIFDIDNTLVPHDAPADEAAKALFERLRSLGMKTMLLSNNQEPRVKAFALQVDSPYIFKAGKPGSAGYERAMEQLGTSTGDTLSVGDQIFTDVWGSKRAGLRILLTRPMDPSSEPPRIALKRRLEGPFLRKCRKT